MKHISTLLFIVAGMFCSVINAQTTFPNGKYIAITKPGTNISAPNYKIYTSSNPVSGYDAGVSINSAYDINGIGFNPQDNYVYGSAFVWTLSISTDINVALYRIGADGNYTDLGYLPAVGSDPMTFVNYNGAAVSSDGKYYYIAIGLKASGVQKFMTGNISNITPLDLDFYIAWVDNIAALPANAGGNISSGGYYPIDVSDPTVYGAMSNYIQVMLTAYPNIQTANGGIQDIAISPSNTDIYGYITYPDMYGNNVGNLIRIAPPPNGTDEAPVTVIGTAPNTTPGVEMDGITFGENNNLYGLFINGNFAQIDVTNGTLSNMTPSGFALTNGNLRGDYTGYITNTALPVKLASQLSAQHNGKSNLLKWSTASEINFDKFELQRSIDNKTWTHLAYISGKSAGGNSSVTLSYSYEDKAPFAGTNYYRLSAIDLDGTALTVSIASIANTGSESSYGIYPNPAKDNLYITGITGAGTAVLYNVSGRIVITQKLTGNGSAESVNVKSLAGGVYHLVISAGGQPRKTFSVIVAR